MDFLTFTLKTLTVALPRADDYHPNPAGRDKREAERKEYPEYKALLFLDAMRDTLGTYIPNDKQHQIDSSPAKRKELARFFVRLTNRIDFAEVSRLAARLAKEKGLQNNYRGVPTVIVPVYGKYHLSYRLRFENGTMWMIKFPFNGTRLQWTAADARALESEAWTMRMLQRELGVRTKLNVPRVYDFNSGVDNPVGAPYILMHHIAGRSLYDLWFHEWQYRGYIGCESKVMEYKHEILSEVAAAMYELGRFQFDEGGAPVYNDKGELTGIGPARYLDTQAMVNRWIANDKKPEPRDPIYAEASPFTSVTKHFLHALESWRSMDMEGDETAAHCEEWLRKYVKDFVQAPAVLGMGQTHRPPADMTEEAAALVPYRKKFVLAHPDLNLRNIMVGQDGKYYFIGWDGVAAVPRVVGNEALPLWLVRDWNPFLYKWLPQEEFLWKSPEQWTNSHVNKSEDWPGFFSVMRYFYVASMRMQREKHWRGLEAMAKGDVEEASDVGKVVVGGGEERAGIELRRRHKLGFRDYGVDELDVTALSVVRCNLWAAARDQRCQPFVLQEIYHRCEQRDGK